MREQEAVYLPWRHVNFERGTVRIRSNSEFGFKVKDKEQRDVPLPRTSWRSFGLGAKLIRMLC